MKYLFTIVFLFLVTQGRCQYASKVLEYRPAPGQMINTEGAGSHVSAASVTGGTNGLVSLGGFGGFIVLGFDQPVLNHPENPYGVDFTIFGNPSNNWAEPGIVMVMKDENQNGIPDDAWYELAGSDHFFSNTKKHYRINYRFPNDGVNQEIPWSDNYGASGIMPVAGFYAQPYYPSVAFFPEIGSDSMVFSGTCIQAIIDLSNPGNVLSFPRTFGYVDNRPRTSTNYTTPDNPYTEAIEGCGGDPMDISWAIDSEGRYVEFDRIDFVKIYTGVNQGAGWLGELSTEVKGIVVHSPQPSIQGQDKIVVIRDLPRTMVAGQSASLEAIAFDRGRQVDGVAIEWHPDQPELAGIDHSLTLTALKAGHLTLNASVVGHNEWNGQFGTQIVEVASVKINLAGTYIKVDESMPVAATVLDKSGNTLASVEPDWEITNPEVLVLTEKNGKRSLAGLSEGGSWVKAKAGEKADSVFVQVYKAAEAKTVYVTIKDKNNYYAVREKVSVSAINLNPYIDRAVGNYDLQAESPATVAHAIVQFFLMKGLAEDLRFRDDQRGNNRLYLWKVPAEDQGGTAFIYGYGGTASPATYAKAWIVHLNNRQYVNGFDQFSLKNGDELLVYHQDDLAEPWNFERVTMSNYSPFVSEWIDVTADRLLCSIVDYGISVQGADPVAGESLFVDGLAANDGEGNEIITDERGMARIAFQTAGRKSISVGKARSTVEVAYPLGQQAGPLPSMVNVYPVPANRYFFIEYNGVLPYSFRLYNAFGKLLVPSTSITSRKHQVDLIGVASGIYFLVVESNETIITQKILVR